MKDVVKTLEEARGKAHEKFNNLNTKRGQLQVQLQQVTEEMVRIQGEVRQLDALLKEFTDSGGG